MRILFFMSLVLAQGCATNNISKELPPLRELLAGEWSQSKKGCRVLPAVKTFSDDGKFMFVNSRKNEESGTEEVKYMILAENESIMRMKIEDEKRQTPSGEPVVWDLIVHNENQYCWRRTDWSRNDCTKKVKRCKNDS